MRKFAKKPKQAQYMTGRQWLVRQKLETPLLNLNVINDGICTQMRKRPTQKLCLRTQIRNIPVIS